jgi:hypothetical protein
MFHPHQGLLLVEPKSEDGVAEIVPVNDDFTSTPKGDELYQCECWYAGWVLQVYGHVVVWIG